MLLCAQGLRPAKQAEPRAAKPYLYFVRSFLCFGKVCYALAAAQATIVLPAFVRSLSADGGRGKKIKNMSLRGGTTKQSPTYKVALYSIEIASYLAMTLVDIRGLNILILNDPEEIIAVSIAHGDDLVAYLDAAAFDAIDLIKSYNV